MDIAYCNNNCNIGRAARDRFLEINNSAFDAATDFRFFTENCFKTCPHKEAHIEGEKQNEKI